jgi:hypothetical protein
MFKSRRQLEGKSLFSRTQIQESIDSEKRALSGRIPLDPEKLQQCQNLLSQACTLMKTAETTLRSPGATYHETRLIVEKANKLLDKMMEAAGLAENIDR